jgi:hypothetical protein
MTADSRKGGWVPHGAPISVIALDTLPGLWLAATEAMEAEAGARVALAGVRWHHEERRAS